MRKPPPPHVLRPVLALVAAASLLAACGGSHPSAAGTASSGALTTVKLVSYTSGAAAWIGYIGKNKGIFAKDGINLDLVTLPAGAQATTALVAGDLDVANLDLNNLGPALASGQKFDLLVNEYVNNWQLLAPPAVQGRSLQELMAGFKTVGVPSLGGAGTRFVQYLAQVYGGTGTGIKYVVDPNGAALVSKQVDATATDPVGGCVLEQQGFVSVFSFLDLKAPKESYPPQVQALIGLPALSYWASDAWVKAHPQAVTQFQKAVQDTIAYVKDPTHGDEVAQMLIRTVWHVPSLPDAQWVDCVKHTVTQFDPRFPASAVDTWNTFVKATKVAPNGLPPASQWLAPGVPQ